MSVLPNGGMLDACMELLSPLRREIRINIHLNLTEGPCVAEASKLPLLVDERGMFHLSFFKVLLLSFSGKRKELKRQIRTEIRAQLLRMLPYVDTIRIDSHQHYHMIPLVLESILEEVRNLPQTREGKRWLAEKEGRRAEISFIRIPAETLLPFIKHPELYSSYRPINLVKNLVLNLLNIWNNRRLRSYRKRSAVFFGILLSGRMDLNRVSRLLPEFERIARKRNLPLEVLCHPGGASAKDSLMDTENQACAAFYLSSERRTEKEMLLGIRSRFHMEEPY